MNITRGDFEIAVKDPSFDFDDFLSLVTKHLELVIDDSYKDPSKKEELINLCWQAAQEKVKGIKEESVKEEPEVVKGEPKKIVFNVNKQPEAKIDEEQVAAFANRKSHIIFLAKSSKYMIRQIVDIIDESWGYKAQGKNSKTRVNKTIQELVEAGLVKLDTNNLVTWLGER